MRTDVWMRQIELNQAKMPLPTLIFKRIAKGFCPQTGGYGTSPYRQNSRHAPEDP